MTPAESFSSPLRAFSRAQILALADRPAPCLQSRPARAAASFLRSCNQLLVSVGGHATATVFTGSVVDRGMVKEETTDAAIGRSFISVKRRTSFNMRMDGGVKVRGRGGLNRLGNDPAAALTHAHHWHLADSATTRIELFTGMLVRFLAADVSLVDFNNAGQHGRVVAASLTQALEDEPSRLLGDTYLFAQLKAADALAGSNQHVHGIEPFVQRHMAALEDRARSDGEVFLALVAPVITAFARRDAVAKATNRAAAAIGPKTAFKVAAGRFLIWKEFEEFERADGQFVIHDLSQLDHQCSNVGLKLAAPGRFIRVVGLTRLVRRIVRRRVTIKRHLVLGVFCRNAFRRVDDRAFTTLRKRKSGLFVVDGNSIRGVDCDGHGGLSDGECKDFSKQIDTLLSGHIQGALCIVNLIGLFAAIEVAGARAKHEVRFECVYSAGFGPDFGAALARKVGDVNADLTSGWVGPGAECCHDVCSVWNASYRLDSEDNLFAVHDSNIGLQVKGVNYYLNDISTFRRTVVKYINPNCFMAAP